MSAPAPRRVRVAAAVIRRGGTILLTQRPPGGPLGLLWEFPGGKIEADESPESAVVREVEEELGVTAIPFETMRTEHHEYPHGLAVEIVFVRCELAGGDPGAGPGVHALRWVRPADVSPEEILEADRSFLRELAEGG